GKATAAASAPTAGAAIPSRPAGTPPPAPAGAANPHLSPAVRKEVTERGIDPTQVTGTGKDGRLTKGDVLQHQPTAQPAATPPAAAATTKPARPEEKYVERPGDRRVPMTMLRARIAERLVQAQHTAAILTTFNEVDMSAVMKLRSEHKDAFKQKHGVNLSFMSFFTKASIAALKAIPEVNATIDGKDIVYHDYYDVGIAVGTERGLVVPVIRGADQYSFAELEKKIGELALKARD